MPPAPSGRSHLGSARARLGAVVGGLALLAACQGGGGTGDGDAASTSTTGGASTSSSLPPAPPLAWASCGEAECATLTVPRDYRDPAGGTFHLAVARRRAERPDLYLGVLVYQRAGPGTAGTPGLISGSDRFSVDLRARFDIVTWDLRGVDEGGGLDCVDDPDYFRGLDPTPDTRQEIALLTGRARGFIDGCVQRAGEGLAQVSTAASARDVDALRAALGEEQISYLGVSYGAALGAAYATLFPERVRAMVLDGGYDPSAHPDDLAAQRAAGRERVLTGILVDCARDPLCYFHNSGEPRAAFATLMTRVEAAPLVVGVGVPKVDQGEAWRAVLFGLSEPGLWTRLTMALDEAQAGDGMELLLLSEESVHVPGGETDGAVAVECLDWPSRGDDPAGWFPEDLAEVGSRLGTAAAPFLCEQWPVAPQPIPPVTAGASGPVLVTAVSGDPVGVVEAARGLADALPGGVLLVVEGTRRGAYQPGEEDRACAVAVIDWHLISLTLPRDGSVCAPGGGLPRSPA